MLKPVNSSPKELKREGRPSLNMHKYTTLSEMMKRQFRPKKKAKKKEDLNTSKNKSFQEDGSFALYGGGDDVRIRDLLRESRIRREKTNKGDANSFLDSPDSSFKNQKLSESSNFRADLNLENIMKSSTYLRHDRSLTNSGVDLTPKKFRDYSKLTRSPERFSIKRRNVKKSGSKTSFDQQKNIKKTKSNLEKTKESIGTRPSKTKKMWTFTRRSRNTRVRSKSRCWTP